jgi:hypothetical protein
VLYSVYAILMILASIYRRSLSNKEFFVDAHGRYFRTGGRLVVMTMALSLGLYISLLMLLLRIP